MKKLAVAVAFYLATAASAGAAQCLTVGTWNLEYFGVGKSRGFPEAAGEIGPRTNAQLDGIAQAIRDTIGASVLILNEINGRDGKASSAELEDLVQRLGPSWKYAIDKSGRAQRNAMIWDGNAVDALATQEIYIAPKKVNGQDIFERDPLAIYFRAKGASKRADFLVVALHLKSGQGETENHDAAMDRLRRELKALRGHNDVLPAAEDDILIGGDLNASPYDGPKEGFFDSYNRGNWKLLAEGDDYPATRLAKRQIDYLIVTRKTSRQHGLWDEEVAASPAHVWRELAGNNNLDRYRKSYSDHFPVTTCVDATTDND